MRLAIKGLVADQKGSKLLLLPAEIQTKIFEYVFEGSHIRVQSDRKGKSIRYAHVPGMLFACKKTWIENRRFFFRTAHFYFDKKKTLDFVGSKNRCLLRNVTVDVRFPGDTKTGLSGDGAALYREVQMKLEGIQDKISRGQAAHRPSSISIILKPRRDETDGRETGRMLFAGIWTPFQGLRFTQEGDKAETFVFDNDLHKTPIDYSRAVWLLPWMV